MNKWKKTAKIQKKWDIPKGQPHFLALKIVYLNHFIKSSICFTKSADVKCGISEKS